MTAPDFITNNTSFFIYIGFLQHKIGKYYRICQINLLTSAARQYPLSDVTHCTLAEFRGKNEKQHLK